MARRGCGHAPARAVRRVAVSGHGGRRGPRPASDRLSDRDRWRGVVAGGAAGGERPGNGGAPYGRRQAGRRAARAVECALPRARVRRPVLPACSPVVRAASRVRGTDAARPRDRVRELRRSASLCGRAGRHRRQAGAAPDHPGSGRRPPGPGRAALRRLHAGPERPRDLVCAGGALHRQGHPGHRGRAARRLGHRGPVGGPAAGDRHRLLRVPDTVTRWHAPGLDLVESPAHAVGRHRAQGRHGHEGEGGIGRAGRAGRKPLAGAGWSRAACGSRCWPRPGGTTPACTW